MKSLFQKKWKYPKRAYAKHLRDTANMIDKYGFVKHTVGSKEIGFCTIGASFSVDGRDQTLASRTIDILHRYVDCSVVVWNDDYYQTKQGVTHTLRKLARKLEHGLDL